MPHIKKTITAAMGLPAEALLNLPFITILGREELIIENHKCILWADSELVRVNTACGVLKIQGKDLNLREISRNYVKITGTFEKLEFLI